MSYTPERTPDTQMPLIVLYTLNKLGICYDTQLFAFLSDRDLCNWMEMMFSLDDLCQQGCCVRQTRFGRGLYSVTEAGRETLSLFSSRVPDSVKKAVENGAAEAQKQFRREQACLCDAVRTPEGNWEARMTVMDGPLPALTLTLPLPDEKSARRVQEKWPDVGGEIYTYLIARLSEDDR